MEKIPKKLILLTECNCREENQLFFSVQSVEKRAMESQLAPQDSNLTKTDLGTSSNDVITVDKKDIPGATALIRSQEGMCRMTQNDIRQLLEQLLSLPP